MQAFVKTIHPRGVLSFAPDSEPLPNGCGKVGARRLRRASAPTSKYGVSEI